MKRLFFIGMLIAMFAFAASAQSSRGVVSGTVVDPSGAVVEGATVVLLSDETNTESTAVTNSSGFYRFDAVNLGTYSVSVTATGFGKVTKTGIAVSANQTSSVDVALAVGNQEVTVEITADAGAQLQTESAVRGGNITTQQITDLPGSNPVALALNLPGVASNRSGFGIGTFVVNGARSRSNNFLIDGTENNDISVAGQGFQITNQDAVQEVSVQTGNYDSEFGRAGGAVVNVITKSGTGSFHGTLGFEYDSSADDALTAAQSRSPAVIARGRRLSVTQFVPSATFGGPLFLPNFGEGGPMFHKSRDRNFFFVAYEETRFRQPGGQITLIVPTAAGRAKLQQFAGSNPFLTTYLAATANTIAAAPDRPAVSLDQVGQPVTRGSVEIGPFFRSFDTTFTGKQFQLRTDHRLTDKDQLTFRYLQDIQVQPLGSEIAFPGFDSDFASRFRNFLIAETHVFSSTQTNELRLAYNRIDYDFFLSNPGSVQDTLPLITPGNGLTALGSATNLPQGRIANNYQIQDTFTQVLGDHTFRIGVDYLRQISTQVAPANIRGSITYGSTSQWNALANFVDDFGGAGAASKTFGNNKYHPSLHRVALFGHDRWKFTRDLTLTMGLRWESFGSPMNSLPTPAFTGLFNVDPVTRLGPYSQPNKVKSDWNNFAPSVGFAWSPSFESGVLGVLFGEKKSVIRAGYNIGYDSFFNNIASNAAASSPNQVITTVTSAATGPNPRGLPSFSNQFPANAATLSALSAQTLIAQDLVNPYYQRWSFGMQRELPFDLVMDVSYVGSKGTKLYVNEDSNPLVRPELRVTPINPNTGQPVTGNLSNRLDNIQGSRLTRTNGGDSNYHAGQLEVRRRFANNFQLTGAYTWSKLISNADEVFAAGLGSTLQQTSIPAIYGGLSFDRALSINHRAHRGTFTYIWMSPFFKNQQGFIGRALGGYQIGGFTQFESGVPITITNGFDADGLGGALDRPSFNPNGIRNLRAFPITDAQGFILRYIDPSTGQTIDPNTAMYIVNPTYTPGLAGSVVRFGNLGRNTETSFGINTTNLTLLKRTRVSEKVYIDARAEMFNAFNHPQFGAGSTLAGSTTNATTWMQPINPTSSGGAREIRYQVKLVF
jgi:hypothetical protein